MTNVSHAFHNTLFSYYIQNNMCKIQTMGQLNYVKIYLFTSFKTIYYLI